MSVSAPVVCKTASFWCHHGPHDKVYRLEIQSFNGKFDVFGLYGRRTKKLTMHVLAEGVYEWQANDAYDKKLEDLLKKGYHQVHEDVSTTSSLTEVA